MSEELPRANNGCSCECHRTPGITHLMACCSPASEELLPCPFCGVRPDEWEASPKGWVHIQCPNRKCVFPHVMDLKKRAYAKWNTRPDSKPYKYETEDDWLLSLEDAGNFYDPRKLWIAARERREG